MDFRDAVQQYAEEPLTRQVLMDLLKDYKRPNDKINELIKKGELTPLKKGFYIPGPKLNMPKPESFLIANHLWDPVMFPWKQHSPIGLLFRNGCMR